MFNDTESPSLFDPSKDVAAVFIDFENMRLTVEETGDEPFQINKVLDYVDQHIGRVTIKKAYSNWHYVNPHMYNLLGNNIDLIQIYTSGSQRKNAADIRLSADAVETLFMFPQVTTFIIVASDSDYSGLIINLRKHGKKVVGIGTRQHTSEHLVRACNLFRFYRTIAADDPHSLRDKVAEMDIQEAKDLLVRAMSRHRFADRPAVGRWLRWQMIQLAPSFDEADLGFGNFREFLEACGDVVKVTFDERYQEIKVELKNRVGLEPTVSGSPLFDASQAPETGAEKTEDAPNRENPIITITSRPNPPTFGGFGGDYRSEYRSDYRQEYRAPEYRSPEYRSSGYGGSGYGNSGNVGAGYHSYSDYPSEGPQTFPQRPEDIKRSDYLRTLWEPRIYLYSRDVAKPILSEIFRINGPGSPLSQYELEEYLLGGYADTAFNNAGLPRYELTQKTIYAIQKLMFWAGTIRFLENDEHVYWKKRKREIVPEYKDARGLLEGIDLSLARHFARFMPLLPEILQTILLGDEDFEYAKKIVTKTKEAPVSAPPVSTPVLQE